MEYSPARRIREEARSERFKVFREMYRRYVGDVSFVSFHNMSIHTLQDVYGGQDALAVAGRSTLDEAPNPGSIWWDRGVYLCNLSTSWRIHAWMQITVQKYPPR